MTIISKEKLPRWREKPGIYAETNIRGRRVAITTGDGETGDPVSYVSEDMGPATLEAPIVLAGFGVAWKEDLRDMAREIRELRDPPVHPDPDGKIFNQRWHDHLQRLRDARRGRTVMVTKHW